MITNVHTYLETNGLHCVAFQFVGLDPRRADVTERANELKRWCTENYGLGYANYTDNPTNAERMRDCQWVTQYVEWGEIYFKEGPALAHFLMTWMK